jgi:hypothetical protein
VISCLVADGVELLDSKNMVDHALEFYKKLFGEEPRLISGRRGIKLK